MWYKSCYMTSIAIVDIKEQTFDDVEYYSNAITFIRAKRDQNYSIFDCLKNLKFVWIEQTGQKTIEDENELFEVVKRAFRIPTHINLKQWYLENNND